MINVRRFSYRLLVTLALFFFTQHIFAQLTANAGPDKMLCPGVPVPIGGAPAATGGLPPYTYSWSPATGLSNTTIPNPTALPPSNALYTLTVTDDTGAVATSQVQVVYNDIQYITAGTDTSICENSFATLGGPQNNLPGVIFRWNPSLYLNDSTIGHPITAPLGSMTYTLTASSSGCPPKTDVVTVTVIPTPILVTSADTTINEGETVTLHVSGASYYSWTPTTWLSYPYTYAPDVEPLVTTTYYVYGTDPSQKCYAVDSVKVTVEPSDDLVFYNAFTPNGDGENDTWYIGNIYKYPDNELQIFNRYGKLVYKTHAYLNTWDGKAFGQELPSGTYFYLMDLHDGSKKRNGTVTILR